MKFTPEQIKVLEALWASVGHWLENWEWISTAQTDSTHCPLCQYAFDPDQNIIDCESCPVMWKTGVSTCDNTPWYSADCAINEYLEDPKVKSLLYAKEKVEIEYRFLVNLALEYSETGEIKLESENKSFLYDEEEY